MSKLAHIGMVPSGSPLGTPTHRLCDGKKSKTKAHHWSKPVCSACVTAMAREVDMRACRQPIYTWTVSTWSNATWITGNEAAS